MLESILQWFTSADGGAFIVVAFFSAWFLEKFAFWKNLDKEIKIIITLLISGLIGGGAAYLQANPEVVKLIDPYISPFIYSVSFWLTQQAGHEINPFRKRETEKEASIPLSRMAS